MDKSCQQSSSDSTTTSTDNNTNNNNNYLRHLNKLSHKISKPPILKPQTSFDHPIPPPQQQNNNNNNPLQQHPPQNPQHQPPVYNINKNDFRDVVQKLTGAPTSDRISTPQPIQQQPKQQSSRLQRIRPPPLPHITNRPPPLLNAPPQLPLPQHQQNNLNFNFNAVNFNQNFPGFGRAPAAPLSPLPPFPTVHAAAESPISAYMRDLQSFKGFSGFSPLPLPPVPETQQQQQQQQQQEQEQENQPPPPQPQQEAVQPAPVAAQSQSAFQMPSSPGPFGCLNSQLASYPLLSPGLLFSPNSGNLGFPQLPLSPTVPVPSPRWRGI
ncbi:unnamed protein product [Trifolium pratense]|uniref:Uncharacterized protein n=1 Tax=Trifolium pratense TaxID=57577 RepID=A0ACB0JAJ4_TRIPR|nr:unnamed protein product [Trifolium pratense]